MAETYTSGGKTYTRPSVGATSAPAGVSFGGSTPSGGTTTTKAPSGGSSSSSGNSSTLGFMDGSSYNPDGSQVAPISKNPYTGSPIAPANSPVTTSDPARSAYAAILDQINKLKDPSKNDAFLKTFLDSSKMLSDRSKQLEKRKKEEVGQINQSYAQESAKQVQGQKGEVGTQSMGLARIGGFDSASGQAVLTNLARVHEEEKQALYSKKESAILQANQAFEDKDFELAQLQVKDARDAEQQIYDREKDYVNMTLQLKGEERADQALELQKTQRLDTLRKNAEEFNYEHNVASPFITVDGKTVLRAETHEPVTQEQFFKETGYKSWDEVPAGTIQTVQRPVGGLSKDQMIQGKDGWYDLSTGTPRLVIPESPNLQVIGTSKPDAYGETHPIYGSYDINQGKWVEANAAGPAASSNTVQTLNNISQFCDGTQGGQCGDFAHTLANFPKVGNTLATKQAAINAGVQNGTAVLAKQWRSDARVGDVLISSDHPTAGHVMVVIGNNGDGTVTVKDSNYSNKNDEKIRTRTVSINDPKIYGAFRSQLKVAMGPANATDNGVVRNSKMDGIVNKLIEGGAGGWGQTADMIDAQFGHGTASLYDKELKQRFLIPDEAQKFASSNPPKTVGEWQTSRTQFVDHMKSEYQLDGEAAGAAYDKNVPKPTATAEGDSALTRDYFKSLFGDKALADAAIKAGYSSEGKILGIDYPGGHKANVDGYLDNLMNIVQQYRESGYTDKQILDMMKAKAKK